MERNVGSRSTTASCSPTWAQFTDERSAGLLDNYVRHGGSVVFFLGDRVRGENYNRALADVP